MNAATIQQRHADSGAVASSGESTRGQAEAGAVSSSAESVHQGHAEAATIASSAAMAAASPAGSGRSKPAAASRVLLAPTPQRWFDVAAERWRELLVDHANCEKKAASTALSLIFSYPEDMALTDKLSRLAREELRHFEQVQKLMQELRVPFARMQPSRYAEGLRRAIQRAEPARLLDLLLCGALIEARSCERFEGLAPQLAEPLRGFYSGLAISEARHQSLYLRLAEQRAGAIDWQARLQQLATIEAELVTAPDPQFRFHSGLPA